MQRQEGRRGPLGPAMLAACTGRQGTSRGQRRASRLQSWMTQACPESGGEPGTHGRLGRLGTRGQGQGNAQGGQSGGARHARGIWAGVRVKAWEAPFGNASETSGLPWGQDTGFLWVIWSRTQALTGCGEDSSADSYLGESWHFPSSEYPISGGISAGAGPYQAEMAQDRG